ncbi:NAD(P)-dependent oxidoreductase [Nocardioides sp.]|uniref:NAD(P)-dependent oxidoreductase n=1 Tax=Nocardioides sp. TaxID=35761 RepID=UPI0039E37594
MDTIVITDTNLGDGSHEKAELEPEFIVRKVDVTTEDGVLEAAADADGLLVQWAPITERVLAGLPRLRAVVRYGIGLDNIDLAAAERHGVRVSNVDDYCLDEVADHAAAAIYAHSRRLTVAARSYADHGWTTAGIAQPFPPRLDPVGVAGFGRIGRAVAARVAALGFPVHAWDPYVTDIPEGVTMWPTLRELAEACHHLSLNMPATAETTGLVDAEVLAALGPEGHLVNTARGALVVESDLLAALEAGTLGFATLDVLSAEPPTGIAAELAAHPRVLVNPHIAYLSTESLPQLRLRAAQILADLLRKTAS